MTVIMITLIVDIGNKINAHHIKRPNTAHYGEWRRLWSQYKQVWPSLIACSTENNHNTAIWYKELATRTTQWRRYVTSAPSGPLLSVRYQCKLVCELCELIIPTWKGGIKDDNSRHKRTSSWILTTTYKEQGWVIAANCSTNNTKEMPGITHLVYML